MSAFSSQSDIVVAASLELDRSSWKAELAGAKSDLEKFASESKDAGLKLGITFDHAQVRTALDRLQADVLAMGPIRVPVQFVGGGAGGGDWRSALAEVAAGYGGGGVGAAGGATALRSGYRDFLAARIARPTRLTMADVVEEEPTLLTDADVVGGGSGGGRRGGMRGMRLMMAGMMAFRGVENVWDAYRVNRDLEERMGMSGVDPTEGMRESIAATKQQQSGLTGMGRSLMHWALTGAEGRGGGFQNFVGMLSPAAMGLSAFGYKSSDFDDAGVLRQQEQNLGDAEAIDRGNKMAFSMQDRLRNTRETFNISQMGEGLPRRLAEIHKATQELNDGFDKEARLLEQTASKIHDAAQKQSLVRQASAMRAEGGTLAREIEINEAGLARHEDFVERTNRSDLTATRLGMLTAGNTSLAARLQGDTLGAARATITARRDMQRAQAIAAYRSANGKISAPELGQEIHQIDLAGNLELDQAQKSDALKWARLTDEVHELGLVSPYARSRQRIIDEGALGRFADPAHAALINQHEQAQLRSLDYLHGLDVNSIRNAGVAASWMRNDPTHFHTVYKAGHRPQKVYDGPDPEYAGIRQEGDAMDREIAMNQGDPEKQRALIDNYRSQLQDQLQHTSGARARNAISSYLQHLSTADQKARADARNALGGTHADAAADSALAKVVADLAQAVKGAQNLYVVK